MADGNRLENVLKALKDKGLIRNQQQFAEMVGSDKSTVSLIKNGRISIPNDLFVRITAAFPQISIEYLKNGEGSPLIDKPAQKMVSLPLLPVEAMAGLPSEDIEGIDFQKCERYLIPDIQAAGAQYLIRVTGDSMMPNYKEGDILACRMIDDVQFWQPGRVYVLDTNQGPLVKVVFNSDDDDHLVCHSFNSDRYKDFKIPKAAIRSVSIVVGVVSIRTE